jgi:hypothetical protein
MCRGFASVGDGGKEEGERETEREREMVMLTNSENLSVARWTLMLGS